MSILILYTLIVTALLAGQALAIWLGSRILRMPKASLGRAFLVIGLLVLTNIALLFLSAYLPGLLLSLFGLGFAFLIVKWVYKSKIGRALALFGFALGGSAISLVLLLMVVRPLLFEAYIVPTVAMAPALVGPRYTALCPLCGRGHLDIMIPDPKMRPIPSTLDGICDQCGQMSSLPIASISTTELPPDRIAVDKLTTPRRWDIVAFKYRSDVYVKRLVALPGETIFIKDGKVFINGSPITPPPPLAIQYITPEFTPANTLATPEKPLSLKSNEYFFLGDFSQHSHDSRWIGPIPQSDFVGVVTVRYWPLDRFQIFR
jgi:signal peptidase I